MRPLSLKNVDVAYTFPSEMMELSEAALLAHRHIFSSTLETSSDSLDVVATALSGHIAVFGFRHPDARMSQLTEDDYAKGTFRRGATCFEYRDAEETIMPLGVRKTDVDRALKMLSAP